MRKCDKCGKIMLEVPVLANGKIGHSYSCLNGSCETNKKVSGELALPKFCMNMG